ncbi:MAG TPA: type II toxin-antitoxin system VapC family toxin [Bdellovibrionota bacterium]|nr:type II toxin-antitoxin system VapC family toxin [Bdellovibrionota bacterium]
MNIAIDTSAIVCFFRGEEVAKGHVQKCEEIVVPFIVIGELRAGFVCGKKTLENEKLLAHFLNSPRASVLFPNEDTTHHYAKLFHQLRTQGTPIPTNDLWIAALCIQHDLPLFSLDKHFHHIPQLVQIS